MGFLREIVAATEADLRTPSYGRLDMVAPRVRSSLREAILRSGPSGALLVEFKRNSPGSDHPELPVRSPTAFVTATEPAGVAGYSCIATAHRFGGSPGDVASLCGATDRPVLFKDFVIDPRQIEVADRAGARAILLIARLESAGLLRTSLAELARVAHARRLEVLLEFHERSELRRAGDVGADMFGVNVRDLDSLRMEPAVAADTLRAARGLRPLLGLSGVNSARDADRFWNLGVDGILVGSAVARAKDPASFLATLRRTVPGGP
jgi:indole-3-glycerol phosphate synthase